MSDEKIILRKAREAITSGRLPNRRPDRLLVGKGFGAACAVCNDPVTPDQAAFELEFASGNGHGNGQGPVHHIHIRCFAAWEFERHGWPADLANPANTALRAPGRWSKIFSGDNSKTKGGGRGG